MLEGEVRMAKKILGKLDTITNNNNKLIQAIEDIRVSIYAGQNIQEIDKALINLSKEINKMSSNPSGTKARNG